MEESELSTIAIFVGVALVGYIIFSLFTKLLVKLGMAVSDNRKKLGIRATTFGRFMQLLFTAVIILIYIFINNKS